jgi:hypothetical protein
MNGSFPEGGAGTWRVSRIMCESCSSCYIAKAVDHEARSSLQIGINNGFKGSSFL